LKGPERRNLKHANAGKLSVPRQSHESNSVLKLKLPSSECFHFEGIHFPFR
jgi:hypothetical protein